MKIYRMNTNRWFLERLIFLIGGFFVFVSVLLGLFVSSYFYYFTVFVGAMQIFFAFTGYCPMAIFLNFLGVKEK